MLLSVMGLYSSIVLERLEEGGRKLYDGNSPWSYLVIRIHDKCIRIKKTPWLLVRKRTIPTERPLLVGEVSANFLWIEGVAWPAQRITTAVNLGFL
jgi:hypothetical protein